MADKLKVVASLKIDESVNRIATDLMVISAKLKQKNLPAFVGNLDKDLTRKSIESALAEIKDLKVKINVDADSIKKAVQKSSKSIKDNADSSGSSGGVASQIFDVNKLKKQGILYLDQCDRIVKRVKKKFLDPESGWMPDAQSVNVTTYKNATGQIQAFVAEVTKADGVIEKFNFKRQQLFDSMKNTKYKGFVLDSQSLSDKNSGAELEKRLNLVQKYQTAISKIRYSATNANSGKSLMDVEHLSDVRAKMAEIEGMLDRWKLKNTAVTQEEIREYNALKAELDAMVQKYRDVEKVKKQSSGKDNMKSTLDYLARAEQRLATIESKTLRQANPLKEGTEYYNTYKQYYDDALSKLNEYKNANKAMTDEQKRELGMIITQLQNVAKEQQRAANPPMIASRDVTDSKMIATAELDKLEAKWKRQSFLTDDFRKKVAQLRIDLDNVSNTEGLKKYQADLQAIKQEYLKLQDAFKNNNNITKLNQQSTILYNRITAYMRNNTKAAKLYGDQLNQLREQSKHITDTSQYQQLNRQFQQLTSNINAAGKAGNTFATIVKNIASRFSMYFGVTATITKIISLIRTMISDVGDLDKSMVALKRVTNETDETYEAFFKSATESAKKLSSSINDIVSATADFAKLGYNIKDASQLAEIAKMYSNVADMDISDATNNLVSVMKAYNIGADDAIQIVDKFDILNNTMSVTASELGEGSKRAAAVLASAGNSLDQTLAMISGASEITQDVDKTSNAFRTLALRIQGKIMPLLCGNTFAVGAIIVP